MIYVLIPLYNEADNIGNLFAQWKDALPGEEKFFVFSDDGSTDASRDVVGSFFKNFPHIILGDGKNYGPGNAFNVGFEWIVNQSKNNNDVVVTMEADTTSDISILPIMLALNRLGYDLILASIYAQGGGFDKTSFFRRVLSSVANMSFRVLFDIKVLTLSSFYRVYAIGLLKQLKQENERIITEKGFICMVEVLIKSIRSKAKIIEVPMVLKSKNRVGKSKMKIFKTSLSYINFMIKWKLNAVK